VSESGTKPKIVYPECTQPDLLQINDFQSLHTLTPKEHNDRKKMF